MRIRSLHIKDKAYKNLDIELNGNSSGVMAFIGNNGSGKSNLLEALSVIFNHLYQRKEKDIPFDFSLSYQIGSANQLVQITKRKTSVISQKDDRTVSDVYSLLPKQIIAIYSGEEDRLWKKCYRPLYLEYINNITSGKTTGLGVYNEMPKMMYINKFYWHISLLCLLLQQFYNEEDRFCSDILNIKKVNSIKFVFNKKNYENYQDSQVKNFITTIDKKQEYSLIDLKSLIDKNGFSMIDVFKYLYIAFTPDTKKMLEDIIIKYNDENLEIEDFSEGEKKMLLIKAALEFAGLEDSLFLLDEPDSHIHLNNKVEIKKVFEAYKGNRQVILTTHSPTLTDSLEEEGLFMLDSGKLIPHKKQEILESVSGEFMNKLQQNAYISTKKPIILLVEGAEDKIHLNNAYEKLKEYYELDFDIFNMTVADNIEHFIKGIYSSELKNDRLHICILDFDNKGMDVCRNLNTDVKNADNFKVLLYPKKQVNQHHEGSFTVENMYEPILYENAYKEIMQNFSFDYKSIDKISTNIQTKAKGRLAGLSYTFDKEDFNHFKIIFDKIKEHFDIYNERKTKESTNEETNPKKELKKTDSKTKEYKGEKIYIDKFGIKAKGIFFDGQKVIVKAGSTISGTTTPSFTGKTERKRQLRRYCKKQDDGNYLLQSDIEFNTPSGAMKFVAGSNLNGWDYWLTRESGRKLQTIRYKK